MSTFVFVPGGMHGGWCWKPVVERLRGHGHDIFTPTLTGLGERAHLLNPSVNLDTHIADIMGVLEWEDLHNVILVGHSYGGMVITAVADRAPERLAQLVYLDAMLPEDGEAVADLIEEADFASTVTAAQFDPDAGPIIAAATAAQIAEGCGVTDPEDAAWMASKLTPQPWASMTQPLKLHRRTGGTPVLYVACCATRYQGPELSYTRAKTRGVNDHTVRTVEIDAPHSAMLTHPDLIADLLTHECPG